MYCSSSDGPLSLTNTRNLNVIGDSYQDIFAQMKHIFSDIDEKYPYKKKGIFLANDTYAKMSW